MRHNQCFMRNTQRFKGEIIRVLGDIIRVLGDIISVLRDIIRGLGNIIRFFQKTETRGYHEKNTRNFEDILRNFSGLYYFNRLLRLYKKLYIKTTVSVFVDTVLNKLDLVLVRGNEKPYFLKYPSPRNSYQSERIKF